jgi:hypothetical protein
MLFKLFKQNGKDIIVSFENIVSIKFDETSKKTVIHSISHSNEVDESFDEIKTIFGVRPKKEIKGF